MTNTNQQSESAPALITVSAFLGGCLSMIPIGFFSDAINTPQSALIFFSAALIGAILSGLILYASGSQNKNTDNPLGNIQGNQQPQVIVSSLDLLR